ncbi:hypothetical protein C2E25_17180 [Geothermobacter hydrogeniphilus]|uniref:Uncharacterized protein n=1 Tax=Geothermobacter hydrogeniphilus TaxID=1969733 RepID=A0A2K2H5L0_9BACT|nr:hypothetical protein [Geothermobacter hydrogeniphilus]PNU18529.1 hypothetical protein C2E25_17180 [Geothermobacter hydrogeniphilus]
MATEQDYIQQAAGNDPTVTEAVRQAIQNSSSAALSDPAAVEKLATGISAVAQSYATIIAQTDLPLPIKIWSLHGGALLDTTVNIVQGEGWVKSIALAITSQAVSYGVGALTTAIAGSASAPFLIAAGGVAVGWFAADAASDLVGQGWDYIIGPSVKYEEDKLAKSISITSRTGSISNILHRYWETSLSGANEWLVRSDDDQEFVSYNKENDALLLEMWEEMLRYLGRAKRQT